MTNASTTSLSRKTTIFALSLVILIDSLTIGLVIPLFAALFNDPHGILPATATMSQRNMWYALIFSLPMFAMLFGAPLLGEWSDRIGRKKVLVFSLVGVAISCLLSVASFYASSVILLLLSRVFVGLLDSSQAIAQAAIIDISTDDQDKVKNLTFVTFVSTLGWIIGPILGGILSDAHLCSWFNYRVPFWVASGLALLNVLWLQRAFHETRVIKNDVVKPWTHVLANLIKSFFDKRIILLSIGFLCLQFSWSGVYQVSNLLLAQKFHYPSAKLGLFSTYLAFFFSISIMVLVRVFLKYLSIVNLVRTGFFIFFIGILFWTIMIHHEWAIWVAIIPMTIGIAMTFNSLMTLFSDAVTKDEQGKVMGIMTGLVAIAWLLAGLYSGMATSLSYTFTLIGFCIVALAAFIISLFYHKHSNLTRET
jgi:DHA1 family tetracycline resistance protein-like MFS transporter